MVSGELFFLSATASLGSSIDTFIDAAGKFFSNLASIHWGAFFLALLFFAVHLAARSRSWFNILRAAYPEGEVRWWRIFGSYVAGLGINSITPIHGGDLVKIYLAKQSINGSNYVTTTSSILVEAIFDAAAGSLVLIFALTQGVLPSFIKLPDLPAFDLSFWASHPSLLLLVITLFFVVAVVVFALLVRRVKDFWRQAQRGWTILKDRNRYLRQVAAWQFFGWLCKLTAFYFFLSAFSVDATVRNAMLVMAVQALSTLMPFTPNGAGAQQALLVYIFRDVAAKTAILSYSVGQQIAIAALNVSIGFTAIFTMAKTLDWKVLRKRGEEEKLAERR